MYGPKERLTVGKAVLGMWEGEILGEFDGSDVGKLVGFDIP